VSKVVLIIGQTADLHVQRVQRLLEGRGVVALLLDPGPADSGARIAYSYHEGACRFVVDTNTVSVTRDDVVAVWWRNKPPAQPVDGAPERRFAFREWQHALEGLEDILADVRWVNRRSADRRACHKVVQLREASRWGLAIPPTLISNDPDRARQQVEHWKDEAIYKPLSWYVYPPDRALFTSRITTKFLADHRENIRVSPGIFQPLIKKAYDLRITVVGQTVFPVRIESQRSTTTELDWRRDYDALTYASVQLPAEVQEKLLRLHAALDLTYGAYDFIVTPRDEYVFLEVNPAGQWLWMEDALGIGVAQALADFLAG
jgi:hypothetical protein